MDAKEKLVDIILNEQIDGKQGGKCRKKEIARVSNLKRKISVALAALLFGVSLSPAQAVSPEPSDPTNNVTNRPLSTERYQMSEQQLREERKRLNQIWGQVQDELDMMIRYVDKNPFKEQTCSGPDSENSDIVAWGPNIPRETLDCIDAIIEASPRGLSSYALDRDSVLIVCKSLPVRSFYHKETFEAYVNRICRSLSPTCVYLVFEDFITDLPLTLSVPGITVLDFRGSYPGSLDSYIRLVSNGESGRTVKCICLRHAHATNLTAIGDNIETVCDD